MRSLRAETERWFVQRGVPHLIEDYGAATQIWTRARAFLIGVLLLQTLLAFTDRYTGIEQGGIFLAGSVTMIVAIALFNRTRGRRMFDVPDDVGVPELVFFVVAPAVLTTVVRGDSVALGLLAVAANAAVLAVTYVVVGFGLIPMTHWSLLKLAEHVRVLDRLMARTLPVLLILTVFMFINAEIWQVAYSVPAPGFAIVCSMITGVGLLFLWLSTKQILGEVDTIHDWEDIARLAADTPVDGVAVSHDDPPDTSLGRGARMNLHILLMVGISTQVVLAGALVAAFYVAIGLVFVTPTVLVLWTGGEDIHRIVSLSLGSFDLTLTREHLRVSGLVGVLAGLNTAVAALNDEKYRETFTADLIGEIEQNLAVRSIYRRLPVGDAVSVRARRAPRARAAQRGARRRRS